jgi:hypothetical protein
MAEPPPEVPVLTGAVAETVAEGAATDAEEAMGAAVEEETGAAEAAALVEKTPESDEEDTAEETMTVDMVVGELAGAEGATTDAEDATADAPPVAVAVLDSVEAKTPGEPPPIPFTAAQVPVKEPTLSPPWTAFVTSGPGLGNCTSVPSTVVQPLPKLATKRSGRDANEAEAVPDPVVMVMAAQSM